MLRNLFSPKEGVRRGRSRSVPASVDVSRDISAAPSEENIIQMTDDQLQVQLPTIQSCPTCGGPHAGQDCQTLADVLSPTAASTAATASKTTTTTTRKTAGGAVAKSDKEGVEKLMELNQLIKQKEVDGDRVAEIMQEVCDRMLKRQSDSLKHIEAKLEEKQRDQDQEKESMLVQVNQLKIKEEKLDQYMAEMKAYNNPCTPYTANHAEIDIPVKLFPSTLQKPSLERFWRLERVFKHVPVFHDDNKPNIRQFLNGIVTTANSFPSEVKLTEPEYFQVLWGKLGSNVQAELSEEAEVTEGDARQLHKALLESYDMSETGEEAYVKLQSLKPSGKMNTVMSLLREAKRLKELCPGTETEKARSLAISIKSFLPWRLKKRLEDIFMESKAKSPNHQPDWKFLTGYLKGHREEVDEHLEKLVKKPNLRQVNGSATTQSQNQQALMGANNSRGRNSGPSCEECGKIGHASENCWSKTICGNCGKAGHPTARCRTYCRLCGMVGHGSVSCKNYPGQVPMSQPCQFCLLLKNGMKLYHNQDTCKDQGKN